MTALPPPCRSLLQLVLLVLGFVLIVATGDSEKTTASTDPPQATILSPQTNTTFEEGSTVSFTGKAEDATEGLLSGPQLVWISSRDQQIGTGTSFVKNTLSPGTHTITLVAENRQGRQGIASITLVISPLGSTPPTVTLKNPAAAAIFEQGDFISFEGTATDSSEGRLSGTALTWTSSRDKEIGTGESFSRDDLSTGTHILTLKARNSRGIENSSSVTITVNPKNIAPPVPAITSPATGSSFEKGDTIIFQGSATDPVEGRLVGQNLVWRSSKDKEIGMGENFVRDDLSVGSHTLTLTARNSHGVQALTSTSITITPRTQTAPTVTILEPTANQSFETDTLILFRGKAEDPLEGLLSGGLLTWHSSRETTNPIGTGESFGKTNLAPGAHTITLLARNSQGIEGYKTVAITINPKTNTRPTATIVQPLDQAKFKAGELITFHGQGSDTEDGRLSGANLVWTSNRDQQIGTGESFSSNTLTTGVHTLSLVAWDSQGIPSTPATIGIEVENTAPVALILLPATGTSFRISSLIQFRGSGNDAEDGILTGTQLRWSSNRDGQIGTGENLAVSTLTAGNHTIRLTATDLHGKIGWQDIDLIITP